MSKHADYENTIGENTTRSLGYVIQSERNAIDNVTGNPLTKFIDGSAAGSSPKCAVKTVLLYWSMFV